MTINGFDKYEAAQVFVDALNQKFDSGFSVEGGRKFIKIVHQSGHGSGRSVSLFVEDAKDQPGVVNVLKAATWKAPAKGTRYQVSSPADVRKLVEARADKHGAWLYVR